MKVLVRPHAHSGSDVVHLPAEDGKPKCNTNGPRDKDWVEKEKSLFPNAELCDKCENGTSGGVSGPILANKLSELDTSEV